MVLVDESALNGETKEFEKEADKLVSKIEQQTEAIRKQELVVERTNNRLLKYYNNAISKFVVPEAFDKITNTDLSILRKSLELSRDKLQRLNDDLEKTLKKMKIYNKYY